MRISKGIRKGLSELLINMVFLSGCVNLPNIYKPNLTADSPAYKSAVFENLKKTEKSSKDLQQITESFYVLNSTTPYNPYFNIQTFQQDSNKIAYLKWRTKSPKEVLIYLNGLESHSGWFSEPAQKLAERGIVTYGLDRRGSGLNTRLNGNSKDWIVDVDKIIKIANKENPDCDINIASLCFGARLASSYAIEHPNQIDSLIYISPGFEMNVGPGPLEIMSIFLDVIGIQTNTQSPIKKDELFTLNPFYLQFISNDKLRTLAPSSDDYLDGQKLLEKVKKNFYKIQIPSLILLGKKDKIINNQKTKKILERLGKKPQFIEYDSQHTIFFESEDILNKFVEDIYKFLRK